LSINRIRNFCIIAHIDHGKSTLADCLLKTAEAINPRKFRNQLLDNMDLERERGITIKASAVTLDYEKDGEIYSLNLIDTPGHVDFSYEVSRSLCACEGALLVIDASQGVEAQTLANVYLALEKKLIIIPVINKIDLPSADPDRVKQEIEDVIGIDSSEAFLVSGKSGEGVSKLLEAIVERIPAPKGKSEKPLQALIFDSWFDSYKGVIILVRVMNGQIIQGQNIYLMNTNKNFLVQEVGAFTPHSIILKKLGVGEVGFIAANIREVAHAKVGDTLTCNKNRALKPLSGFKDIKSKVFAGVFPIESVDFENLREILAKLSLNDAALIFEPERSSALGFGFRCGFLGLLHLEIVQERLEREFNLDLIITAPTVVYKAFLKSGQKLDIDNPSHMPDLSLLGYLEEPFVKASIHTPSEYVGSLIGLCEERKGKQILINYISQFHVVIGYDLPMSEIVFDFFDKLKSISRGYASLDYESNGYQKAKLVKVDILLNGDLIDALSIVVHRHSAQKRGKNICKKMKKTISRQQYEVVIQAAISKKIIARESIPALRKDVTAKCYGGDISRKRKLLEKQKKGKKRMRKIGKIEIPQAAFLSVLKID